MNIPLVGPRTGSGWPYSSFACWSALSRTKSSQCLCQVGGLWVKLEGTVGINTESPSLFDSSPPALQQQTVLPAPSSIKSKQLKL